MEHICFVIGAMNYSGAEKVLSIIASELAVKKYRVSVILLEDEVGAVRSENSITTYGAKATGNKISRILNRWKNIRNVVKQLSPDVVVSFGSVCNVNTIPAMFGVSIPLVVCERNDPVYDPRKQSEKFTRWILYRFAKGYVFQTERIRDYFSNSIRKKSAVIPNPIIDSGIRWSIDACEKSIATVARLDDFQKDHRVMFQAFAKFSDINPDYTLDIYGDGPDRKLYEKLIEEMGMQGKIVLHGKSHRPLESIRTSEVFLLTSKFEGMPNALMEALSIGMPCVSTDCGGGGAAELCLMANSGSIVPIGDTTAISDALCELVQDRRKKVEYSDRAVVINDLLSKERIVLKWEDYLSKLVKN